CRVGEDDFDGLDVSLFGHRIEFFDHQTQVAAFFSFFEDHLSHFCHLTREGITGTELVSCRELTLFVASWMLLLCIVCLCLFRHLLSLSFSNTLGDQLPILPNPNGNSECIFNDCQCLWRQDNNSQRTRAGCGPHFEMAPLKPHRPIVAPGAGPLT